MNIKIPNVGRFVPDTVARKASVLALKTSKNSPTILFGAGVVGMVGTVVLASRATLRLENVLIDAQKDLVVTEEMVGKTDTSGKTLYTEADRTHDRAYIYVRTSIQVARLYAPAVVLGTLSIAALTKSHTILVSRNNGLIAAYATLEKGFDAYRERVRGEVGEDKERDLFQDVTTKQIKVDGKKSHKIRRSNGNNPSIYGRYFDETNVNWQPDPEANRIFIDAQKEYLQGRLHRKSWVSLNEAYRCLGLPETVEGQQVGWVVGRAGTQHPQGGDPYVDFGLGDWPDATDYVNGREVGILLDFNVTTILDKI